MKLKIRRSNIKRLASICTLGAGVFGAAEGTAEASSIVFSGPLNETVGDFGFGPVPMVYGPGGARATFGGIALCSSFIGCLRSVGFAGSHGLHGTRALAAIKIPETFSGIALGPLLAAFPLHAVWGSREASTHLGLVAISNTPATPGQRFTLTDFNSTDEYLLFRFVGGQLPYDIYGWAQLNVSFTQLPSCINTQDGCLSVTLVDYAYDTSGAQIPAGDTGTPEPPNFVSTGLAALALGAKGMRAWRAARNRKPPLGA